MTRLWRQSARKKFRKNNRHSWRPRSLSAPCEDWTTEVRQFNGTLWVFLNCTVNNCNWTCNINLILIVIFNYFVEIVSKYCCNYHCKVCLARSTAARNTEFQEIIQTNQEPSLRDIYRSLKRPYKKTQPQSFSLSGKQRHVLLRYETFYGCSADADM